MTNNRAEFTALLDGLTMARDFLAQEAADSAVHGDSAIAMDVMRGRADCRDPMVSGPSSRTKCSGRLSTKVTLPARLAGGVEDGRAGRRDRVHHAQRAL